MRSLETHGEVLNFQIEQTSYNAAFTKNLNKPTHEIANQSSIVGIIAVFCRGLVPQVQDAFLAPGVSPTLGVELRALDVIGFNRGTGPEIQSVTRSNNTITLTWTTVQGQSYQVQNATNLLQNAWTNSGSSVTATNTTASFTDTIGPALQKFYRVALLPPGGASSQVARPHELILAPLQKGTNYLWPK